MEQAILALLGVIVTLILYLDRGRRQDIAQLRTEMNDGFKQVNNRFEQVNNQFEQVNNRIDKLNVRIDTLSNTVMQLGYRVGRLDGRAEEAEIPQPSPT